METAISVNGISVSYNGSCALKDLTLAVGKGELVCIVGPNGGGKTTFLNTLLGFLKPDKGEITLFGEQLKKANARLGYVPQTADIDRNFPITVKETIMTAFLQNRLHPFKRFKSSESKAAISLLETVGLEKYSKRQISELSGGEFQRLLIARALALKPDILLLDEPTANVDTESSAEIYSVLDGLHKSGITVVMVTHDLSAAESLATRLICINRKLIYSGQPLDAANIGALMYGKAVTEKRESEENDNA